MLLQLHADNLTLVRGERILQRDLSFKVLAGHALALTGANGAGKTTLLRTIAGFLLPGAGTVRLTDPGAPEADDPIAERCHYVGHLGATKARLTVGENLAFWARYLRGSEPRVDGALERLELAELRDIPSAYLSAGQRRRVGLGRLLVASRPLWLLDEPMTSLDAHSQRVVAAMISEHLANGGIAVVATHAPLPLEGIAQLHLGATPFSDGHLETAP